MRRVNARLQRVIARGRALPLLLRFFLAVMLGLSFFRSGFAERYTPKAGSPDRVAIMNAARRAQRTSVTFAVNYLFVFRDGDNAIAVADLNDASKQMPYGGLLFFQMNRGQWRALYSLSMDGSESCKKTIDISEAMIAQAADMNAPATLFPSRFFTEYNAAVSSFAQDGNDSDCSTTAAY